MLRKTNGAIKNGQSSYTGNIGNKKQHEDKIKKKTTQNIKTLSNTDPTQ